MLRALKWQNEQEEEGPALLTPLCVQDPWASDGNVVLTHWAKAGARDTAFPMSIQGMQLLESPRPPHLPPLSSAHCHPLSRVVEGGEGMECLFQPLC